MSDIKLEWPGEILQQQTHSGELCFHRNSTVKFVAVCDECGANIEMEVRGGQLVMTAKALQDAIIAGAKREVGGE